MDLYDHYLDGETLIIEHLHFERIGDDWMRHEVHRIVGRESEEWSLRCLGPDDHSDLEGPPGPNDDDCQLCARHLIHTKALHRWHQAEAATPELTIDL